MENLGLGVMIGLLGGNRETVEAIQQSLNKEIKSLVLRDNRLTFEFTDDTRLNVYDDGQSCCEHRYMKTDDNLPDFIGAKLLDFELKDGGRTEEEDYGYVHEIQFLDVKTDKGIFQMANHNDHN